MSEPFVDSIAEIFERQRSVRYTGPREEPVTSLEHALQCAYLAEREESPVSLTVAALLHDIGHFVAINDANSSQVDDCHEAVGADWLGSWLPKDVTEPIRLHVNAKRALCATEPGYYDALSPASKHSLELQGGIFNEEDLARFVAQPFAEAAMKLRRWDDSAKRAGEKTPPLQHYLDLVGTLPIRQ